MTSLLNDGVSTPSFPVNVLIDWEAGSNGTTVDATYLATVTRGNAGTWSTTGSPSNIVVDTSQVKGMPKKATYSDSSTNLNATTRSMFVDMPAQLGNQVLWTNNFGSSHNTLTAGVFLRLNTSMPVAPNFSNVDMFWLHGGTSYVVVQYRDRQLRIHTNIAGAGSLVPITLGTWYYIALKWVRNDKAYMRIFNATSWPFTEVGSETSHTVSDIPIDRIMMGSDSHGDTTAGAGWNLDNFMVDWTNAAYPLGLT